MCLGQKKLVRSLSDEEEGLHGSCKPVRFTWPKMGSYGRVGREE